MHGITGYRDVRWFVDGDDAVAFYVLEAYGRTIDIAERFAVRDGEIREIEAIFDLSGRPTRERVAAPSMTRARTRRRGG